MKSMRSLGMAVLALLGGVTAALAIPRSDIIWARQTTDPIVLDGILSEAAWAQAETKFIEYGQDAGIPGSGWFLEAAGPFIAFPTDRTRATLRFLVKGNQLYMAATVPDSSIGGSEAFNRFDALLMSIKDHSIDSFPKGPAEYFYTWWKEGTADPQPAGELPNFRGRWGSNPPLAPRDSTQIANWDAGIVINGLSNSDAVIDNGYTVEMRFNLEPMGYNAAQPNGETIEFNIQVYDNDWFWPLILKFCSSRVWWQSPWGNAMWWNEVRILTKPSVTTKSGPLPPSTGFDLAVPELSDAAPTINGTLTEPAWTSPRIYDFDIRWDDNALRATYPETGKYRSGQFQPDVNGGKAFVLDPADCTVKTFFKGNNLYLGFDVRDGVVQHHPDENRWDGFIVSITDKAVRDPINNELKTWRLAFRVGPTGLADAQNDLPAFLTAGTAQLALALKPGTTVDTTGSNVDVGYTAELSLNLTAFGYPSGLGDGALYLGVDHLDGDSFFPTVDSYGTRVWWFREHEGQCCPAIAYLAPLSAVDVATDFPINNGMAFARAIASPSSRPGIEYTIPGTSKVILDLYDISGRLVETRGLGVVDPGTRRVDLGGGSLGSGVYLYRLRLLDPNSEAVVDELHGKTVLVR